MEPVPKEVRAARAFLHNHKRGGISPRLFAASAKELGVGFKELLRLIGEIGLGGQGQAQVRQRFLDKEALKQSRRSA